jgi:hypothetical protein
MVPMQDEGVVSRTVLHRLSEMKMNTEPGGMTLSEDRRFLAFWAADCAERALPFFEAKAPTDTRPRQAIEELRAFARGGKRIA